MATDVEKLLSDIHRDNRRFAVQLVVGFIAALAIGVSIGVWGISPMLLSTAPASQTAPVQPLAPG